MEAGASRTAILAAVTRGSHRLLDPRPWVLDDPFAHLLVGPSWSTMTTPSSTGYPPELQRQARAGIVVRSRYAEDRLEAGDFAQYVLLGAGLDSLAWRRPDLLRRTRVIEVDHPASQAWKLERVRALGLPEDPAHVFAPVDFEIQSLRHGLDEAGFDWDRPTLFAWLGVTMYLTEEAIAATLATIAGCVAGSEVVLSYGARGDALDEDGRRFVALLRPVAAASGEPLRGRRSTPGVVELVARSGLRIVDQPGRDEVVARYFAGRADGMVPYSAECLLTAAVQDGGPRP
jgi:methyltransferase (TIGR00027 family)